MYTFTNRFSGPTLRQRIDMINRQQSGTFARIRYVFWGMLVGTMALACRHIQQEDSSSTTQTLFPFPLTNATRIAAAALEQKNMPWFRQAALVDDMTLSKAKAHGWPVRISKSIAYPKILCLRNNHLALRLPPGEQVSIFINGQPAPVQSLSAITFEEVNDLLVYQKWEDWADAEKFPESYRVFFSTTHKAQPKSALRNSWKQYLQAAAISDFPLGESNTFSMNSLMEATFFSNKRALVKLTKDDHLKLYDEFLQDIEVYINGLVVKPQQVEDVHVREIERLYTRERRFDEWADGPNHQARFALYIQTTPKRAKRDSSYYVFSPFYTGDF